MAERQTKQVKNIYRNDCFAVRALDKRLHVALALPSTDRSDVAHLDVKHPCADQAVSAIPKQHPCSKCSQTCTLQYSSRYELWVNTAGR